MTTPSGTISMSQVNTELTYSSSATITLNDTAVRTLAGKSSGIISMFDLRGKTYSTGPTSPPSPPPSPPPSGGGTVTYPPYVTNGLIVEGLYDSLSGGTSAQAGLRWGSDGVISTFDSTAGYTSVGSWTSSSTSGFWIKLTRTSYSGPGAAAGSTATTGWLQLSSNREALITASSGASANYTAQIATDSAGSTVVSTLTFSLMITDSSL